MIATPTHIEQPREPLPAPAICTPADFNQYLARAKARALAALVRIIDDPAAPPDEVRKAASVITRAGFIPSPRPASEDTDLDTAAILWGACDSSPTSSAAIEFEKFNATVKPLDDEGVDESNPDSQPAEDAHSDTSVESENHTEHAAAAQPSQNAIAHAPPAPHTHPPLPPAPSLTPTPSVDPLPGNHARISLYAPNQRQI